MSKTTPSDEKGFPAPPRATPPLASAAGEAQPYPSDQRPRLQQIATSLGVSKMTVSRALRNGTSVDSKLRAKIRKAAARLGYQPNPQLSLLISEVRKSRETAYRETLAFIWMCSKVKDSPPSFQEDIDAARQRAEELGFKLDEFQLKDEELSGQALSKILRSRGIRGAMISLPSDRRLAVRAWLDWKNLCCVLIGNSPANLGLPCIQHDHFSGMVSAIRQLRRLQYRRIGLVLAPSGNMPSARLIRSAFLSFQPDGLKEADALTYTGDSCDAEALSRWIGRNQPGAIITNLESLFSTLEQMNRALPKAVGVVALNWSRDRPQVAGIAHQRPVVAMKAIDLLTRRLRQNQLGLDSLAPTILVPGSWMNGPSVHRHSSPRTRSVDERVSALVCV
jgi:DNA-binding LacI/PurR family transcriptional regulator